MRIEEKKRGKESQRERDRVRDDNILRLNLSNNNKLSPLLSLVNTNSPYARKIIQKFTKIPEFRLAGIMLVYKHSLKNFILKEKFTTTRLYISLQIIRHMICYINYTPHNSLHYNSHITFYHKFKLFYYQHYSCNIFNITSILNGKPKILCWCPVKNGPQSNCSLVNSLKGVIYGLNVNKLDFILNSEMYIKNFFVFVVLVSVDLFSFHFSRDFNIFYWVVELLGIYIEGYILI
jgi:hypothetical protein